MTISRPWGRAALWLAGLGPFFFASYGFATWLTTQRDQVGSMVFAWERVIPFMPWTIIPYWSIDILYGISLFICASRAELDIHARRLLTAQIVAVTCFILFPLTFTFARPEADGFAGLLFEFLGKFDKPFNQAPSLHIALLVILWDRFARHVPDATRWILHGWFALIGVSVLTTFQHHFVDVPTGAWLGFLCLWLWPEQTASPLMAARWTDDPKRRRLAGCYAIGGVALGGIAPWIGGNALWLLWPAASCWLVAGNYALFGVTGFQKSAAGQTSVAAQWLLAPYTAAAWINARMWTRGTPLAVPIADGVFLGRLPSRREAQIGVGIVDLTAELPRPDRAPGDTASYYAVPMLDLIVPPPEALRLAVERIERARAMGPVLVCCALGYGRSAAAVTAWLLHTGRVADIDDAIAQVRRARPRMVLDGHVRAAIVIANGSGR